MSADSQSIIVTSALEDLGERGQVDTKRHVTIAAEVLKSISTEDEGNERNVSAIHSLEGDTGRGAIKVDLLDQVGDRVNDLLEQTSLLELCFKHFSD